MPAADLRRAIRVQAAPDRAFVASSAAGGCAPPSEPHSGQFVREIERDLLADSFRQHHVHHGGNDFAGFFDGDGVADADVFLPDVILVVQRRAADGAAGQENRLQLRHRRERAGASDLDGDGFEFRFGLFGGVFVGDGPARRFGGEPGLLALRKEFSLMTAPSVS